jgi:hypothetical protein
MNKVILLIAIVLATISAYFSVSGLMKLFNASSIAIMVMAIVLELAKLSVTAALHNHKIILSRSVKLFMYSTVIMLMTVTSVGIYGFLSNAYIETKKSSEIRQFDIEAQENSRLRLINSVDVLKDRIREINLEVSSLNKIGVTLIEVRDLNNDSGVRSTVSTASLRAAQKSIQSITEEKDSLSLALGNLEKKVIYVDSTYLVLIKSVKELDTELGPLRLLSEQLSIKLDSLVFTIIIVFVIILDPLALVLVASGVKNLNKSPIVDEHVKSRPEENLDLAERDMEVQWLHKRQGVKHSVKTIVSRDV